MMHTLFESRYTLGNNRWKFQLEKYFSENGEIAYSDSTWNLWKKYVFLHLILKLFNLY